jgi:hypothetical protein
MFINGLAIFKCHSMAWREDIIAEDKSVEEYSDLYSGNMASSEFSLADALYWYTPRELTYPTDALNAFAGISRYVGEKLQTEWCYGTPNALFEWGILWVQGKALERRPEFPSWSWAGWAGAVSTRVSAWLNGKPLQALRRWHHEHTWIVWYQRAADDKKFLSISSLDPGTGVHSPRRRFVNGEHQETAPKHLLLPNTPRYTDTLARNQEGSGVLQFWSLAATFYISVIEHGGIAKDEGTVGVGIFDNASLANQLGCILVNKAWCSANVPGSHEFVLISDASSMDLQVYKFYWNNTVGNASSTGAGDEEKSVQMDGDEGLGKEYEELDEDGYKLVEWDHYKVMLIEWKHGGEYAERVSVGIVPKPAVGRVRRQWKHIVLA